MKNTCIYTENYGTTSSMHFMAEKRFSNTAFLALSDKGHRRADNFKQFKARAFSLESPGYGRTHEVRHCPLGICGCTVSIGQRAGTQESGQKPEW
eukprot:scaffold92799_cov26-Prasinocladus_malaysianus.AAC.1